MPFAEVSNNLNLPQMEAEIAARWRELDVFQRSIQQREGAPDFVFYEGPPTANGLPHMGHVVQRSLKDLFPRYRTMRGQRCLRKAGWDTHGLPVEIEVEKELGLTGKQQIEEYGIAEFNRRCRDSVFRYVDAWSQFTDRLGLWLDLEHPYITYENTYIESVWAILKRTWDRGLLYQGYKVVPYCPRCATPLSSHELSLGYVDGVDDPSVFVRFRLTDEPQTSMLAWTTTPWTLPGNVALAVGPGIRYVKVRQGEEQLILAEERLSVLEGPYEVVAHLSAEELMGRTYEPLYPYLIPDEPAFFIVEAAFVNVEDGTGVVHTAAAYGEDDLRLCREKGIPVRHVVDLRGQFRPEVIPFAGMFVKDADPLITEDLRQRGLLYRAERISHTYPFCWRCRTPLLYYALDSWFIRMSELRDELLAANRDTTWHPAFVGEGRMGNWLENLQDWSLSRFRYWGTPLPVWICADCGESRCVGSAAELGLTVADDLHRPHIDEITLPCGACDGTMRRVADLIDVWFDSGSMPFAQYHWPFENEQLQASQFPADFICEGIDQTRGWFYSLMAISVLMTGGNSYRNVLVNGTVTDRAGRKQSKSVGNVDDPMQLMERFGADALRWYCFTATAIGGDYRFTPEAVQESSRFLVKLWNTWYFFATYARLDGWESDREAPPVASRNVLDRWILARLNSTVAAVTAKMDAYDFHDAARDLEALLSDVSDWYVRRSRRRFWKSDSDQDKAAAYATLHEVLLAYVQLLAPFCPFITDAIWTGLGRDQGAAADSVHLSNFPVVATAVIDGSLEAEMERARRIVEAGLAAREVAKMKVRRPLAGAEISGAAVREEIAQIIRDELNLKSLAFAGGEDSQVEVRLDTLITPELREEGLARELVRRLQVMRKQAGFKIDDRIVVAYRVSPGLEQAISVWTDYIRQEVLADRLVPVTGEGNGVESSQELKFDEEEAWLGVSRSDGATSTGGAHG